jgi:hypothetical protein
VCRIQPTAPAAAAVASKPRRVGADNIEDMVNLHGERRFRAAAATEGTPGLVDLLR